MKRIEVEAIKHLAEMMAENSELSGQVKTLKEVNERLLDMITADMDGLRQELIKRDQGEIVFGPGLRALKDGDVITIHADSTWSFKSGGD